MNNDRRWVVALDLSPMDETILDYVRQLSEVLSPKEIHFVHVLAELNNYSYSNPEFGDLIRLLSSETWEKMQKSADAHFNKLGISYTCHVQVGEPFEEIIRLSIGLKASGVMVGKKRLTFGSGVISERLSRNLPCDFLLIPDQRKFRLNRIMIATDFSDHSSLAMVKAQDIKDANERIQLFAHHSYSVPMGYSKSGKTFEQFAAIILENAELSMSKWLKNFKFSCTPLFALAKSDDRTTKILEYAESYDIDMIVMGSKGQSKISLAFLGSYTLKLLKLNQSIPVLIVKKEGENLNLIDAIKRM